MYLLVTGLLALICVAPSARAQPAGEISGSVYDDLQDVLDLRSSLLISPYGDRITIRCTQH